jgi:hypothetical protein
VTARPNSCGSRECGRRRCCLGGRAGGAVRGSRAARAGGAAGFGGVAFRGIGGVVAARRKGETTDREQGQQRASCHHGRSPRGGVGKVVHRPVSR